ncbi:MAG: type IV secretory system conjugative DNA transfer family protein [Candidatus Paceibacterota bacterium]
MNQEITPIGKTDYRNQEKEFGIKNDDRRRHIYIIGKTGVGKSTLIENMAISDIETGKGIGIVDPHGELAETLLDFIPESRLEDVIYFDPSDTDYPIAFNPLEQVSGELRHLIASSMMGVFKKIWPDVWSARMEYILNNTLLALLEYPGATLVGILKMFSDKAYRKKVVEGLEDPVVKHFWTNEFANYSERYQVEAVGAIQNKVGQFVTNPLIRNILGQPKSSIDIKKVMDEGKILIVNLSKGKIGEDNAALLGAMMVTRIQLAAMSRAKDLDRNYRDFYLYVDEFQNFATDSFATILSEARKYRLSLTLAHQYINQLVVDNNTKVRDAIFGNVGTIVSFRVGANDAEFLEKEFAPEYDENDLVNLAKYHVLIKLMIDGVASKPFSAGTLSPREAHSLSPGETIIEYSRKKYSTLKAHVEEKIREEWVTDGSTSKKKDVPKKSPQEERVEKTLREVLESSLEEDEREKRSKKKKHTKKDNVDIGGLKNLIDNALGKVTKDKPKDELDDD